MSESPGLPPALLKLAGVIMLGAVMIQLDATMTTIATSTLIREFHAPLSTIQWVSTGYLLAMATVIPLAGWALERFGARAVWMACTAAFLVGSVLCGLSWSVGSLIAFRVLQGFGGGLILPVAQSVLAQAAGPQRLGRVMAAIGVPSLLGPVLGPVLGGVIVSDLSWRWIFYVNVPLCLVVLVLARRVVPTTRAPGHSRLDLRGLLLLSGASVGLIYGFAEAGRHGSVARIDAVGPVLAGVVLLVAFVRHALRTDNSIIDLRLFRASSFAASIGTMFMSTVVLFGALGLLPLYYQQARGDSALHTGVLMIPFGVGMGMSLIVVGRLADRLPPRGIAFCGLVLAGAGSLAYTRLGHDPGTLFLSAAQLVSGAGVGAILIPVMTGALRDLPPQAIPRASTTLRIFQQLGGSFGGALLFVVLQRQTATGRTLPAAYGHTFWWAVAVTALAFIPAALLPGRRRTLTDATVQ